MKTIHLAVAGVLLVGALLSRRALVAVAIITAPPSHFGHFDGIYTGLGLPRKRRRLSTEGTK
jgi:hypothetical protein